MEHKTLFYKILANLMAVLHGLWVFVTLLSLPAILMFPQLSMIALVLIVANLIAWAIWRDCPFFQWENFFRKKYDPAGVYGEAFVTHYAEKFFHVHILTRAVRMILYTYGLLVLLTAVYLRTWK